MIDSEARCHHCGCPKGDHYLTKYFDYPHQAQEFMVCPTSIFHEEDYEEESWTTGETTIAQWLAEKDE